MLACKSQGSSHGRDPFSLHSPQFWNLLLLPFPLFIVLKFHLGLLFPSPCQIYCPGTHSDGALFPWNVYGHQPNAAPPNPLSATTNTIEKREEKRTGFTHAKENGFRKEMTTCLWLQVKRDEITLPKNYEDDHSVIEIRSASRVPQSSRRCFGGSAGGDRKSVV